MQRDIKDTSTNKFRHLLTKDNHKIEIPNINIVIRNKFGNMGKSKGIINYPLNLMAKHYKY